MAETESTAVTAGIRVSVESRYLPEQSIPQAGKFVFAYRVRIENVAAGMTVQLRNRHWIIEDQTGATEHVRGPGVVGEEPILKVGTGFEYTSGAMLETPRGIMRGSYQLERPDGSMFEVEIAPFALAMPYSLN